MISQTESPNPATISLLRLSQNKGNGMLKVEQVIPVDTSSIMG